MMNQYLFPNRVRRNLRRPLTVLLVLSLFTTFFVPNAYGALTGNIQGSQTRTDSSLENHWADDSMTWLADQGILKGDAKGSFLPDKSITRAEFAQIAVQLFNYDKEKTISYKDVKTGDWYYSCMSRAAAQGFMQGYNGKANPNGRLSRQDAVVMVAKMLKLEPQGDVSGFPDANSISAYAKGYVGALAKAGYLTGNEKGNMDPLRPLQRCEAIALFHQLAGQVYSQPGTYDLNHQHISGNVTVASPDITLKNAVIQGDLYITEGVGIGNVSLDNVEVKGRTLISGGGMNSIVFINTRLGRVSIEVPDGTPVRLVASGDTSIGVVSADSQCKLQEDNLKGEGFGEIIISVPADGKVSLDGTFDKVTMDTPDTTLDILSGKISDLVVTENGKNAEVRIASDAKVTELSCEASAYIGGTGKITTANINSSGVQISQKPDSVKISNGYTATVNGSSTNKNSSTSGGKNHGSSSSSSRLSYDNIDLQYGRGVTAIKLMFSQPVTLIRDGQPVDISEASRLFEYTGSSGAKEEIGSVFLRSGGCSVEFNLPRELSAGSHTVALKAGTEHTYALKTVSGDRRYDLQNNTLKFTIEQADVQWGLSGPEDATVKAGEAASFSVAIKQSKTMDSGNVSYRWMKNQVGIAGAGSDTYSFTPGINDDGAKLSVQVIYSKNNSNVRICRESGSALLNVTGDKCVLLQPGSLGEGGNQRIMNLEPGLRYYIYSEADQKTYLVRGDGTLGTVIDTIEYEELPALEGSAITGLINSQWYKVYQAQPDQKTLTYLHIAGGNNAISFSGSVSPDCSVGTAQNTGTLTLKMKTEPGTIIKILQNGELKAAGEITSATDIYSQELTLDRELLNEMILIKVFSEESQPNPAEYRIRVKRGSSPTLVPLTGSTLPYAPAGVPLKYQIRYMEKGMTLGGVTLKPSGLGSSFVLDPKKDYTCAVNEKGNLDIIILGEFTEKQMKKAGTYQFIFQIDTDNGSVTKTHLVNRQAFQSEIKVISSLSQYVQYDGSYKLPATPGAIELKYQITGMEDTVTFTGISLDGNLLTEGLHYSYGVENGSKIVRISKEFVATQMGTKVADTQYRLKFEFREVDFGQIIKEKFVLRQKHEFPVVVSPSAIQYLDFSPAGVEISYEISNMPETATLTGIIVKNSSVNQYTLEKGTDYTLSAGEDGGVTVTIAAVFVERAMGGRDTYRVEFQFEEEGIGAFTKERAVVRNAPPPAAVSGQIVLGEPEAVEYTESDSYYLAIYVPLFVEEERDTGAAGEGEENSDPEAVTTLRPITSAEVESRIRKDQGYIVFKKGGEDLTNQSSYRGRLMSYKDGIIVMIQSLSECKDWIADSDAVAVRLSAAQPPDMGNWVTVNSSGSGLSLPKSQVKLSDFQLSEGVKFKDGFNAVDKRQTLVMDQITSSPVMPANDSLAYAVGGMPEFISMCDGSGREVSLYVVGQDAELEYWIAEQNKFPVQRLFDLDGKATVSGGKAILKHEVDVVSADGGYGLRLYFNDGTGEVELADTEAKGLDWDNTFYSLGKDSQGTLKQISLRQLTSYPQAKVEGNVVSFPDVKRLIDVFKINPFTDRVLAGIVYTPKLKSTMSIGYEPMGGTAALGYSDAALTKLVLKDKKSQDQQNIPDFQSGMTSPMAVSVRFSEVSFNIEAGNDCDVVIFDGNIPIEKGQTIVLDSGRPRNISIVVTKNGDNSALHIYRFDLVYGTPSTDYQLNRNMILEERPPDVPDMDGKEPEQNKPFIIDMDTVEKDEDQSDVIDMDTLKQNQREDKIIDMDLR